MKTVKISEQKLKGLERDAARYRFLRKTDDPKDGIGIWLEDGNGCAAEGGWLVYGDCDRAVDAAMQSIQRMRKLKTD